MFLDTATLHDLEIVPTPTTRGATVWSLIDRTRTRLGREALRQRLLAPPHTAEEILALQQAHQVLAANASAYRTVLDHANLDGVEAYLSVTWQLPVDMPAVIRVRKWYRQYVQDVKLGQVRITALFAAATEVRNLLSVSDAPILRHLGEQVAGLLEKPLLRELLELASRHSSATMRAFDQLARERAKPLVADLLRCVGRVEALWSVGAATREHGWSYPRLSSQLRVTGLTHPFLGSKGVPNDLNLDDRVRVCFVTGPNMAGKSTFMKAVAVAVLLAHVGSGVPATSMECPVVWHRVLECIHRG